MLFQIFQLKIHFAQDRKIRNQEHRTQNQEHRKVTTKQNTNEFVDRQKSQIDDSDFVFLTTKTSQKPRRVILNIVKILKVMALFINCPSLLLKNT